MSIQTLEFIFYCSSVQSGKAHASTSVYEFNGMVIGQHICKCVWTSLTEKSVTASMREDKECDKYAINNHLY